MTKPILLLITLTALLAACAAPPADISTASPTASMRTATPSATLTPETPIPDIPTITLLPTIPTFTPTFDARTVVTATPAPRAECPKENPKLALNLGLENKNVDASQSILNYLNQGGNVNPLLAQLQVDAQGEGRNFIYRDLTNDGIADFVFQDIHRMFGGFNVYICFNGLYQVQVIFSGDENSKMSLYGAKDIDGNSIPELLIVSQGVLIIFRWNGDVFEEETRIEEYGDAQFSLKDVDGNGLQEVVVSRGAPPYWHPEFPWRHYVSVYSWNGSSFVLSAKEFGRPQFRFQAIQDGDLALSQQEYDKSIELYQQAIFDPNLKAFSLEIWRNLQNSWQVPSPTPVSPDPTEYPRLAAYAYYRMVILHTFLGETEAAQVKYATLQEKFPAGSPGHPYVEMATGFWTAYQSSGRMYDACAAAIAYADSHPEILIPLGSDYHGWQSHQYTPADVCPFR